MYIFCNNSASNKNPLNHGIVELITAYPDNCKKSSLTSWKIWRDTVSAGRRHTNGYELCPSSSRFIFILIWVGVSQKLVKDKKIHEARAFNFTYRYTDDVLSINNSRFAEFLSLIYPPELEVKETTDTASSASFLDLYLEFDDSGQISTKIYDKRDDFNFKIINFPNMCSNIPASPAYGVYISQLIRYARASSNYSDFLKRHLHLRNRLLDQDYKKIRLIRSLKKFIFRYQDLVEIYSISAEKIISDGFSYSENV